MKLLLIDDDDAIHLLVKKILNPLVTLESFHKLPDKLKTLEESDLVLLDLYLGKVNSLEFLDELKEENSHLLDKIILFTASGNDDIELRTHQIGVRDYVKKPFNPKILSALIDKHLMGLRKSQAGMKYGPFFLDLFQHRILAGDGELDLTVTEFRLLRILIEAKGRIITREKLMRDVWDIDDETQTRTVDMHVSSLRKKLGEFEDMLKTKRGVGFYLASL